MADPSRDGAKKVRSGGPSELAKSEERTALWLLIPTFVIILIIAFYPLGQVFVESFRQREFASGNPGTWVGLQNYQQLLVVLQADPGTRVARRELALSERFDEHLAERIERDDQDDDEGRDQQPESGPLFGLGQLGGTAGADLLRAISGRIGHGHLL